MLINAPTKMSILHLMIENERPYPAGLLMLSCNHTGLCFCWVDLLFCAEKSGAQPGWLSSLNMLQKPANAMRAKKNIEKGRLKCTP